jgi:hypothetical protein
MSTEYKIPNSLPLVDFYGISSQVPFLTKPAWDAPEILRDTLQITPDQDSILQYDQTLGSEFDINYDLISQRKSLGQRVWDATTIYLDHISGSVKYGNIVFHARPCRYYASLTKMIELENETVFSVKSNDYLNCILRKQYYSNLLNIESNLLKPLTIGCSVVLAIRTNFGYEIALQTRSEENVTDNNVTTTVPSYGLSPFIGEIPQQRGLLFYNFLREYLEELHNLRELDQPPDSNASSDTSHDSVYNHPEASPFLSSNFALYYIGFGFILSNGYPTIGLLARLDDIEAGMHIKSIIEPNWEIASGLGTDSGAASIEFVSIDNNARMRELYPQFSPSAVYFINAAVKHLRGT